MNISIYLDEPLFKRMKRTAQEHHLSVSKWVRQILEKNTTPDLPSISLKTLTNTSGIHFGGNALKDTERFYE